MDNISQEIISGVKVLPLRKIPDVRGTIMHGVRSDNLLNPFGEVYFKKIYSGIINGWHVHETMTLNYLCVEGMMRTVLYDMRDGSPTKGKIQEVYYGDDNYVLLHIPPGVANASESITSSHSLMCNIASEPHNPNLKYKRIDPRSGEIPFDWAKKNF
jgi:dTDP-4-dehydrorhamnose 3,5-epimerase